MKKESMIQMWKNRLIGISLVVLFLFPSASLGEDWQQYHGPNRDRISNESGWSTNWSKQAPEFLWRTNIGNGFASFSVKNGRVFAMGNKNDKDSVYCFDAKTGDEIWKHSYPCELHSNMHEGGPCATPAVTDQHVYTLSKEGRFFCLDVKTGDVVWFKDVKSELGVEPPRWMFAGSPLLYKDQVIIDVGRIAAFDQKNGKLIWKSEDFGAAYSAPVAFEFNGKTYFASVPEYGLVAVDGENGKTFFTHPWKTKYGINAATPLQIGQAFFISSGYNHGCALVSIDEKGNTKTLWENRNMRNKMNSSIFWEGFIYGFDEGVLTCLNAKDGSEQWTYKGLGHGSLMLADGKLIILGERGQLTIAKPTPEKYTELSRAQVLGGKCWTIPVLANGRIYCRNAEGDMVCVNVSQT